MVILKTGILGLKLRGSTVIEVVVALVIIMMVFGIATMTYVRIVNTSSNPKIRLQQQLMILASQVESDLTDPDDISYMLEDNIQIHQRVSSYVESGQLLLLELEAFDKQENSLAVYRKVVEKKGDETP